MRFQVLQTGFSYKLQVMLTLTLITTVVVILNHGTNLKVGDNREGVVIRLSAMVALSPSVPGHVEYLSSLWMSWQNVPQKWYVRLVLKPVRTSSVIPSSSQYSSLQ